jgi:outer membrane protein
MKNLALRPLAAALLLAVPLAASAADEWLVRVHATGIYPDVKSSLGGLDVDNQWIPELDISYFFNKNVAAELILGTARHKVTLNGTDLGKVSHLPPTVSLQYHFTQLGAFKPYVGAGVNLTYFYDVGLAPGLTLDKKFSWGGALQIGADYEFKKNWYFNVDVKKLWIKNDVNLNDQHLTDLKIDPMVYGVGIGYRF